MMAASRKKKPTKKRRVKRRPRRKPADAFVAVARRIGADEDKGRFEAILGKIARSVPK